MGETESALPWFLAVMISNCLSPLCYVWLLCKVRSNPLARTRLFLRQLVSLAFVGICVNVLIVPVIFINLRHEAIASALKTTSCNTFMGLFRTARNVNLLQEMQIAMTFLCQSLRWQSILPLFDRCGLYLVWSLGLCLGVLAQVMYSWTYSVESDKCLPASNTSVDLVSVVLLAGCVLVSIASCLGSLWRSTSPQVVRKQNFLRAAVYPVVTLVSYTPVLVVYFDISLLMKPRWYEPLGLMLECSNGMLNTLAFALQSRHARSVRSANPGALDAQTCAGQAPFASWHVAFGGVDVIDMLPADAASQFTGSSDPSHVRGSSHALTTLTTSAISR
jgi:hypothetical protein